MSDEKAKAEQQREESEKYFKVLDPEKGLIRLWDCIHETHRQWIISESAKPGIAMLMESVEKAGLEIKEANLQEAYKDMSDADKDKYFNKVMRNAHKQLAIMSSYCEPQYDIPSMLENKTEALAACLSDDHTALKISAFFLMRSIASTTSPVELKEEMNRLMKKF